jgi:hypothetical protein
MEKDYSRANNIQTTELKSSMASFVGANVRDMIYKDY